MDALILSCGTGGGHNAAARAMQEALELHGHRATLLNPYTLQSQKLTDRIDGAYIGMAQKTPTLFGAVYTAGNLYRRLPFPSPVQYANNHMIQVMADFLEKNHFDVILMPHVFPAEILTCMKRHGLDVPKTVFIATDYTCIPFTEECDCDAYVIPSPALTEEFLGRGIPADRIHPLGIPVSQAFLENMSREEARRELGLEPDKQYILISGGSIGAGKVEKAVKLLKALAKGNDNLRLIAICGSNLSLYQQLSKHPDPAFLPIKRTSRMAAYLRACDLYLTKPGGLSTTEAAVSGVPLGLLPPIPGCESHNLRFFRENGMGRAVRVTEYGMKDILALLEDAPALSQMTACQQTVIPRDAARQICRLAESLVEDGKPDDSQ